MEKTVLVVGLGLIGGSMAKAVQQYTDYRVLGYDSSEKVASDARFLGVIDDIATDEQIPEADIVFVALYPVATASFIMKHLTLFKHGCILIDLCGIKRYLIDVVAQSAHEYGLEYIGGHPMAGKEFSGFEYSSADLFQNASMILVPNESTSQRALTEIKELCQTLGFRKVVCTTAEQHDDMIAFTSQLAHVVSSAYIKSPEALRHEGYSAGSYKDLTRVARLNEDMWTELFLYNAKPLVREIDELMKNLQEYRDAIADKQDDRLRQLLKDGRERKEKLG